MKKFLVVMGLMLGVCAAHATTFYAGRNAVLSDSSFATNRAQVVPLPAPYGSFVDPMTGTTVKRISGASGSAIPGLSGATWTSSKRPHYTHDPAFSAGEKFMMVTQDGGSYPSKVILDSTGTAIRSDRNGTTSDTCAILRSCYEVQWHTAAESLMVGYIRGSSSASGYNELCWFNVITGRKVRTWYLKCAKDSASVKRWGWNGEGTLSYDGRFTTITTAYTRCASGCPTTCASLPPDSAIVVDMGLLGGYAGHGQYAAMALASYPAAWLANHDYCGEIDNVMISPLGHYFVVKYQGTPQYERVYAIDTTATPTASIQAMSRRGLRVRDEAVTSLTFPEGDTTGWIAPLDHMDLAETASGVEVAVGALRNIDSPSQTNLAAVAISGGKWNECDDGCTQTGYAAPSQTDSGRVIMIELATGLHRHVSGGSLWNGGRGIEADQQHVTARAAKMAGWCFVSYDVSSSQAPFKGELVAWKLDGDFSSTAPSHSCMRYGQLHTKEGPYESEAHPSPSPTGRFVMFGSNWNDAAVSKDFGNTSAVDAYVFDTRSSSSLPSQWYVKAGADSNAMGRNASFPSGVFSKANRYGMARSGESVVVNIQSAGPSPGIKDGPSPVTPPSGGARYYFFGQIAHPESCVVASGGSWNLDQSYTSVRGFSTDADIHLGWPTYNNLRADSLTHFIATAGVYTGDVDYCTIASGTLSGPVARFMTDATSDAKQFRGNRIADNTWTALTGGVQVGGGAAAGYVDSLTYRINRHTQQPGTNGSAIGSFANVHHTTVTGNRWSSSDATGASNYGWSLGDSCRNNTFARDTIMLASTTAAEHANFAGGTYAAGASTIDSCYFVSLNGTPLYFGAGSTDTWTIRHTVALAKLAPALNISQASGVGFVGKSYIDHNTFVSDWRGNAATNAAAVRIDRAFTSGIDTVRFTNNIVSLVGPTGIDRDALRGRALFVNMMSGGDSSVATRAKQSWMSNWNLYSAYPYIGSVRGNHGIVANDDDGLHFSVPGTSSSWSAAVDGRDLGSRWGSPVFDKGGPDSLVTTNPDSLFNPAISISSIAVGADSAGGDIGAYSTGSYSRLYAYSLTATSNLASTQQDIVYVYVSNTGNTTLTLTNPTDGPSYVHPVWDALSVSAHSGTRLAITLDAGRPSTPAQFILHFTTNEPPGSLGRIVFLNILPRDSGGGIQRLPETESGNDE